MIIRSKATRLGALVGAVALLGGLALAGAGAVVHAQTSPTPASNLGGPASVPSARFFGSVTLNGSAPPPGTAVTASIGGVACGFGTTSGGTYSVDVQAISGCTAPGATVNFTVGGARAAETGTLPPIEGTAVQLNLTAVAATATPPPPVRTATPPPPPPPPPPPRASVTPPPPPRVSPTATAQRPAAVAQKPAAPVAQKPAAVAQKPGAAAQRPAARPALPSTGTGGLLDQHQGGATGLALIGIILGAVALSATGLVAYRRSR